MIIGPMQRSASPLPAVSQPAGAPEYGARLLAGMIIPAQNTIAEADAHRLLPAGVSVLTARVPLRIDSPEDLRATNEEAVAAARLLASARPAERLQGRDAREGAQALRRPRRPYEVRGVERAERQRAPAAMAREQVVPGAEARPVEHHALDRPADARAPN